MVKYMIFTIKVVALFSYSIYRTSIWNF